MATGQHAPSHVVVRRRDKKRKKMKRRYGTAPIEPIQDSISVDSAKPESSGLVKLEYGDNDEVADLRHEIVPKPQPEFRPRTPTHFPNAVESEKHSNSPHSQLQGDLEAAVQEPLYSPNVRPPPQQPCQAKLNSKVPPIEPLSPVMHSQGKPHTVHHGGANENYVDTALHHIADRAPTPRVSKTKSKASRRAKAPTVSQDQASSDISDYMQIIAYKIRQNEEIASAKFATEHERLEAKLQQTLEAKQALEEELNEALQLKDGLAASLDKQRVTVKTYESRLSRFKIFIDGLGNDVDALKKDANAARRKGEQLTQEGEDHKAERDALSNQLNVCAERSAQLKDEALKACQETQSELQAAILHRNYLDQQLSEKVGLLAEERDRRSHLERQLTSTANSDQTPFRRLKSDSDTMFDKLYEIHAALEESQSTAQTSDLLEKTLAAVQAVNSQTIATADDIISVKALLETLSERYAQKMPFLANHADSGDSLTDRLDQSLATREGGQIVASTFQTHLDNALRDLKEDLSNREKLIQQDASHREAATSLHEKLKASNVRIADYDSQISAARAKERQLQEQNAILQAKATASQSKLLPADDAHVLFSEAKAELNLKIQALESTNADLASKSEEVGRLSTANADLQDQIRTLHNQLTEVKNNLVDLASERRLFERNAQADVERVRKEMSEHTERFQTELQTNASNDLKKLSSERHRLEKQLKALTVELTACKSQLQELQKGSSTGNANREREIRRLSDLTQSQKQEIESLQASLNGIRNSLKDRASVEEENSALSAQLSTEKTKLQYTLGEKSALLNQIQDVQLSSEAAQLSEGKLKVAFEEYRTDKDMALKALEEDLVKAKEAAERSEAGLEHFKGTCKKAVDDENKKTERQAKALNERLSEALAELQKGKQADEEFRAEVERSWQHEQQAFEDRSNEFQCKIAAAEVQRDEAMADNERLREELQKAMNEERTELLEQLDQAQRLADSGEEKLRSRHGSSGNNADASSRPRVPSFSELEGITPSASIDSTAPTKPRKNVDRHSNATMDSGPVPVPEELRPESRRTGSAMNSKEVRGPVVEESQFVSDPFGENSGSLAPEPNPLTTLSDNNGELNIDGTESERRRKTVDETHSEQGLPSFAAFNISMATSERLPSKVASSTFLVPSLRESQSNGASGIIYRTPAKSRSAYVSSNAQRPPDDFSIYEDSQGTTWSPRLEDQEARRHLRDSPSRGQAEKDKYTFQKSFPNPNSASKIVHPCRIDPSNSRHRDSGSHRSDRSTGRGLRISGVRGEGRYTPARDARPSGTGQGIPANSSSPDFVQTTSAHKMSTYLPNGGSSGKRRLSRTNSRPTADPRLAGRNRPPAPKRKLEGYIVEDYEHERKKRLNSGSNRTEPNRFILRSHAQTTINDLPRVPTIPAGPSTSRRSPTTSTSQSRMRTLAGGSSRATRGVKKMSKSKLESYSAHLLC